MSQPDESSQEALRRLDKRLDALQSDRASPSGRRDGSAERSVGEGYRLMGEVIGGVLGGLGLGWVFDHFAHTTPWAMVAGLLIGTALSAYAAMKTADRMGRQASARSAPAPDVADDDEDA